MVYTLRNAAIALLVAVAVGVAGMAASNGDHVRGAMMAAVVALFAIVTLGIVAESIRRREVRELSRLALQLRRLARGESVTVEQTRKLDGDTDEIAATIVDVGSAILGNRVEWRRRLDELRELFDALGEGFLAIDRAKRVLLGNDAFCSLFGVQKPVIGRPYFEVVRHHAVVTAFDHAIAGEETGGHTIIRIGATEQEIEMRVFPRPESDEIAAVALFLDVSQLRKLERARSDFLADFSHEVRTPLAGLRSALETLADGGLASGDEEQLKRIMERQTLRLERLVLELAELNSIESGALQLDLGLVNLRGLLEDLAAEWGEAATKAGTKIVVEGEPVEATIDRRRMEQVVSNLIENAIHHAGSTPEIRLSVRAADGRAEIRVIDQGIGIPDEERENVFRRLVRLDRSRSTETGGSGLGLAIAKHLVRIHGGTIGVEAHEGKGTTVLVVVPIDAICFRR